MDRLEKEVKLREIIDRLPGGIGIYRVYNDGRIELLYLNDDYYEWTGMSRSDRAAYVGKDTIRAIYIDDRQALKEAALETVHTGKTTIATCRIMRTASESRWVNIRIKPVEDEGEFTTVYALYSDIDAMKRLQLQLENNQRSVALAQQQGNMAIWTFDIDKREIVQQNALDASGHMGYPSVIENVPECFISAGAVHPDDIEKYRAAYVRLAAGEEKVDEIYRLVNRNTGDFDWVHMYYQRIHNAEAPDRVAVGFSIVINQQQKNLERYHAEQTLRKKLFANAIHYFEFNLSAGRMENSEKLRDSEHDYVSLPTDNAKSFVQRMSETVEAAYVGELEKFYYGNLMQAFQAGEAKVVGEYRRKATQTAPSFWIRITAIMAQHPDSHDVMAFIYLENIDDEKKRRIAMESTMEDGIESVAIIRVRDGLAHIVKVNPRLNYLRMGNTFTYDEEFVGRAHGAVIEDDPAYKTNNARLTNVIARLRSEPIYQYSVSIKTVAGNVRRKLFRFKYLDDHREDIIISISDITDVYEQDQKKKRELQMAVERANAANEATAQFLSRMSHDMRTPMNGILGIANLSEDETDAAVLKANIAKIKESGEYLLGLINDTLDFQRIQSGKLTLEPRIVDTREIVANIMDMINETAKQKGVRIVMDEGNADLNWYIRADPMRLKQIFINLLSNAIKFTPAGGEVDFSFKLIRREGMISHDVVTVRDNGIGMSREFLKNGIFKPFSQESNAVTGQYAGSGLGLSIAKNLLELMGGHMEVESELGAGTTFSVFIDFERVDHVLASESLQHENYTRVSNQALLAGKKILLVEDHPLNAEIARRILEKAGCIVTWAENGEKGVCEFFSRPENSFDAILMDIRMPVMDGLAATRAIRALARDDAARIPIIAMTANAFDTDIKESFNAGMNDHVAKPFEPEVLFNALIRHISKAQK